MSSASIVQGTPASAVLLPVQGTAQIAAAGFTVAFADTRIAANSIVVCWGLGAVQLVGEATTFSVDNITPGVGFSINSDQAAAAGTAKNVGWAVLKY